MIIYSVNNQEDYKDKIPACEEEPVIYPPDYQAWLDSLPEMTEEEEKELEQSFNPEF